MNRQGYRCTPVIPSASQARPRQPQSKSYKLSHAIDKYYRDSVLKTDLWPDPGYVAQMIIAEYGREVDQAERE